jgi:hypothetical protein
VSGVSLLPAAAADVLCIVAFAIIGRSSHAEGNDLAGVLQTAWPFLVGTAVGLAVTRSWRHPVSMGTGIGVWLCTVAGGVALRLASGSTAQPAFVVVATVTLGLLLVGWRVLYRLVHRARLRRPETSA